MPTTWVWWLAFDMDGLVGFKFLGLETRHYPLCRIGGWQKRWAAKLRIWGRQTNGWPEVHDGCLLAEEGFYSSVTSSHIFGVLYKHEHDEKCRGNDSRLMGLYWHVK